MISYRKLFELMKVQGKNKSDIRKEKIISQDTLGKLNKGTGIWDEGRDPNKLDEDGKQTKKRRITSVDSKSIESLCEWLKCQPSDIMEVIPNKWENAEKLCKVLGIDMETENVIEELPKRVPMEELPKDISNLKWLMESKRQLKKGMVKIHDLIDLEADE